MEINYSEKAQLDLAYWKKSGNKNIQAKISKLLDAIIDNPFEGIGKVEQLKHNLQGKWSRRINEEHRIIYEVLESEEMIKIHSLKGHYN